MKQTDLIKMFQEAMNEKGAGLAVDGKFGPNTEKATSNFHFEVEAIHDDMTPAPTPTTTGIKEPKFVIVKGVKFKDRGDYRTPSGNFKGLTVHYTCSGNSESSAKGVVGYLASQGFGCMTMDKDGTIYIPENFDVFKTWGYHSGVSSWKGISSVSDRFAGMEICCWGKGSQVGPYREVTTKEGYIVAGKYQQYTPEQEASLINFILWAKSKNKEFDLDYIAGHDELRKDAGKLGDKQDPGGSLSMTMPALRNLVKAKAKELKI